MKTSWTYILGALVIGTLSLSACGKKGGSNATPPATAGGDTNTPPGTPTTTVRGTWSGRIDFAGSEGRQLLKKLFKKSSLCWGNQSCSFSGAYLSLSLADQTLPGRGFMRIRTYGQGNWLHDLRKSAQALPENNGFQITYNVNGGWHGGHSWNWQQGGQHCYWTQAQQQGPQLYLGGSLNFGNGSMNGQLSFGQNQAQYVCEEVMPMQNMQVQSQDNQVQMGPQVIDPNQQQQQFNQQQSFWIGNQVQAVAEFKDASKTCILVKLYYMGQLIGQTEMIGTVY